MTPPRLALPLLACAVALTCVACSEGPVGRSATPDRFESDDGEGSRPSPSPSPSATSAPLTDEEAKTAATEIRLVPSDLPGSSPSAASPDGRAAVTAAWDEYRACTGADGERLADVVSDGLSRAADGGTQLAFGVTSVLADEASVERDVEAFRGEDAAACAGELATRTVTSLAGAGAELSEPEVREVTADVPGAEGYGHRVDLVATAGQQAVPISVDVVGFGRSRTEVLVLLVGVQQEVQEDERDALLAGVADRARTAP